MKRLYYMFKFGINSVCSYSNKIFCFKFQNNDLGNGLNLL